MIKIEPLGQRVAIVVNDTPEKTSGGLYIPSNTREMKPMEGTVSVIGPDAIFLKPGDRVAFAAYSGYDHDIDGVRYRIMDEDDVIAKLIEA